MEIAQRACRPSGPAHNLRADVRIATIAPWQHEYGGADLGRRTHCANQTKNARNEQVRKQRHGSHLHMRYHRCADGVCPPKSDQSWNHPAVVILFLSGSAGCFQGEGQERTTGPGASDQSCNPELSRATGVKQAWPPMYSIVVVMSPMGVLLGSVTTWPCAKTGAQLCTASRMLQFCWSACCPRSSKPEHPQTLLEKLSRLRRHWMPPQRFHQASSESLHPVIALTLHSHIALACKSDIRFCSIWQLSRPSRAFGAETPGKSSSGGSWGGGGKLGGRFHMLPQEEEQASAHHDDDHCQIVQHGRKHKGQNRHDDLNATNIVL